MLKKLIKNESGQSIVLVALMMVVLMGFGALAVDIGRVTVEKSKLQNAVDAAALAGALSPEGSAESEVKNVAKLNGIDDTDPKLLIDPEFASDETTEIGEKVYTEEELNIQRAELTDEFTNRTSDEDLIKLAIDNSVTAGLKISTGSHSAAEIEAKRTELTNEINKYGSSMLLTKAKEDDSVKLYLSELSIDSMNEPQLRECAADYEIEIEGSNLDNNTGIIKSNKIDTVKNLLKDELGSKATIIFNKTGLVNALVEKELNAYKNEPSSATITDKTALITALVNKLISDMDSEVLETGEMNKQRVKVTYSKKVPYTLARALGLSDTTVTVYAVAEKSSWAGDALPFINLDGNAEKSIKGDILSAWNKVDPGDKERISNDDLIISEDNKSIQVKYDDGIEFKKGKVMSKIKEPLDNMLTIGKTVYLFSLKQSEIANYEKKGDKELKNGDVIPLEDLVLLECKVLEYDGKIITLEFVNSYNISSTGLTTATDGSKVNKTSRLVE